MRAASCMSLSRAMALPRRQTCSMGEEQWAVDKDRIGCFGANLGPLFFLRLRWTQQSTVLN
jgi:hypothetical protein